MQPANSRTSHLPPRSELSAALASCRGAFLGTALISGMSNILTLAGAMFMLEIYDRVLPSRSMPTLVGLVVLVAGLFTALGILDAIRGRILARVGGALDESLSGRVYDTLVRLPLVTGNRGDGLQPLRDLDAIRSYLSSLGPVALFDLPWIPLYLAICFAFHPLIGFTALGGAIILIGLTVLTEIALARTDEDGDRSRRRAQQLGRNQPAQRRGAHRHGHGRPNRGALGRGQPRVYAQPAARKRRWRRARRHRQGVAHDVAVGRAGSRRISRDPPGGHRRHHHRRINPERTRAGAGRSRHRPLEGIRRRPTELA